MLFLSDLNNLGGLAVVIRELDHPEPEIRKLSAWVIGKASQNNPTIQRQVLEFGTLRKLMKMVISSCVEEAIKALYAISALIRNNFPGQHLFYAEAGDLMLQALLAVKSLLHLKTTEALVFQDFCGLDMLLDRMRQQLRDLMQDEFRKDYAVDVESLRTEVELIYHRKLGKVSVICGVHLVLDFELLRQSSSGISAMSAAKMRPKPPLLSGPTAFCRSLLLLFFFLSFYIFLLASPIRSGSILQKTAAPFITRLRLEIPRGGAPNGSSITAPRLPTSLGRIDEKEPGPYQNWEQFDSDFQEMMRSFRIYVYPDAHNSSSAFGYSNIFLHHPNPYNPKLGNYFSEHMFKLSLLRSSLLTPNPQEAHLFFMPFSINSLRNDPRVRNASSISTFVTEYTERISREFRFWNASLGADHFYVHCHSVGREAASKHSALHNNAIQVTCSSSYFQRLYIAHKDVGLPQVWPRPPMEALTPPTERHRLVFFAGRTKNSWIRQEVVSIWGNDTAMGIFSGRSSYPYEEGFKRSRYCLHIKGYEVNIARISDAIHYDCIPVIISNYYDLPFANILNWSRFSVIVSHREIKSLKKILLSIPRETYMTMYENLSHVRRHFVWHQNPSGYDSFHMTAYQLWLRRGVHRLQK
ncbi:hypothetical protein SAY86_008318 [Trapa natans]|uniref:Exostosin GT47 domain-containing protein n=1 Tax=Trapa natans TaxID=22666 RepID=A0AAN7KGZ5_TRANT|nr:hypothetical protein SAY86_008318 [Trapa natans]